MKTQLHRRRRSTWTGVVGVLLLLACLRAWFGPFALVEPALAQIPDSGLQRKQILEEARRTNQLLEEIKKILQEHTLNVRLRSADNQTDAPAKPRKRG